MGDDEDPCWRGGLVWERERVRRHATKGMRTKDDSPLTPALSRAGAREVEMDSGRETLLGKPAVAPAEGTRRRSAVDGYRGEDPCLRGGLVSVGGKERRRPSPRPSPEYGRGRKAAAAGWYRTEKNGDCWDVPVVASTLSVSSIGSFTNSRH